MFKKMQRFAGIWHAWITPYSWALVDGAWSETPIPGMSVM